MDSGKPSGDDSKMTSLEAKLHSSKKSPTVEDRLTKLLRRETDIVAELKKTMDVLKSLIMRVKTEGVKDAVDKLGGLFEVLSRSREEVRSECRAAVAGERSRADSAVVDSKIVDRVAKSEMAIPRRSGDHDEQAG